MKRGILVLIAVCAGVGLARTPGAAQTAQPGATSQPAVRPIGVVAEIRPGSFTLHTDSGTPLSVQLPEGVTVVRVPPGAKDLKAATKITVGDINVGDRVLVRGHLSDDQKSILATTVIVMMQTDLAKAHEAERQEWQRRGTGGLVKSVDTQAKEITISVPNTPPTPGNPTHPMVISLAPNAVLLRYAPDSVKFSDAKPSTFEDIKAGDQIRALGTKSEDGSRFSAEKIVSGTFRNLAATVIAADAPNGTVTVKDLATGQPVVVHTNADSSLHQLPPFVAQMIAMLNSGLPAGVPGQAASGGAARATGGGQGDAAARGPSSGSPGQAQGGRPGGGFGGGTGQGPRDFNQMLGHLPPFALTDLKPGEALIVVSTQGAKPSEVTAIVMLTGVEPILQARPKGSNEVVLGPWNMTMGGGGGEGGP